MRKTTQRVQWALCLCILPHRPLEVSLGFHPPPKTVTDDQRRRFRQSKQTLTLEAGTLHLQGPKMHKGAEGRRINLRNKEVSREPHLAWCLANWLYHVSGPADHLQGHEGYLSFGLLTWHLGRVAPSWAFKLTSKKPLWPVSQIQPMASFYTAWELIMLTFLKAGEAVDRDHM